MTTPFRLGPLAPVHSAVGAQAPTPNTRYSSSGSPWGGSSASGPNRIFLLWAVHRAGSRATSAALWGPSGRTEAQGALTKLGAVYEDGGTVANARELSAWMTTNPPVMDGTSWFFSVTNDGVNLTPSGGFAGFGYAVATRVASDVPVRVMPPITTSGVGTSASVGVSDLEQGETMLNLAAVRTGDPLTRNSTPSWATDHRDSGIPLAFNTSMIRGAVEGTGARSSSWTWPTSSVFTAMGLVLSGVQVTAVHHEDPNWTWPSGKPRTEADFDATALAVPTQVRRRATIIDLSGTALEVVSVLPSTPHRKHQARDFTASVEGALNVPKIGQLWPRRS